MPARGDCWRREREDFIWALFLSICLVISSSLLFAQEDPKDRSSEDQEASLALSQPIMPFPIFRKELAVPSLEEGTPVCGNGIVESPEACDDRNIIPGDGCTSICTRESLLLPLFAATTQPPAVGDLQCSVNLNGGGTFLVGQGGAGSAETICAGPSGERERESFLEEIQGQWFGIPSAWAASLKDSSSTVDDQSSSSSFSSKPPRSSSSSLGSSPSSLQWDEEDEEDPENENYNWIILGDAADVRTAGKNFEFTCIQPGTTTVRAYGLMSHRYSNVGSITCVNPGCGNGILDSEETCGEAGLDCPPDQVCDVTSCACVPISTCPQDYRCVITGGAPDCAREALSCREGFRQICPGSCTSGSCTGRCCACVATSSCGNGEVEPGEVCGEPELAACPSGQDCQNCTCQAPGVCGNGTAEAGEECSEPGQPGCSQDKPYCTNCKCGPPPSVCGNGKPDPGETCGEKGLPKCAAGSLCKGCVCVKQPACGDNQINQSTEQCDGSTLGCQAGQVCDASCKCTYVCGNGTVEGSEQCDGNQLGPSCAAGQICNAKCKCMNNCGNNVIDGKEQCEAGQLQNCKPDQVCTTCECRYVCGDGKIQGGERCDGDLFGPSCQPGMVCTTCRCHFQCGNNQIEGSEQCDGTATGSKCSASQECNNCQCRNICGNGRIDAPGETCEQDSHCTYGEKCLDCQCVPGPPVCGDGIGQPGEECDASDDPGSVWMCIEGKQLCENCKCVDLPPAGCGNGGIDPGEECGEPDLACPSYQGTRCVGCRCVTPTSQCSPGLQCLPRTGCMDGTIAGNCFTNLSNPNPDGVCCEDKTAPPPKTCPSGSECNAVAGEGSCGHTALSCAQGVVLDCTKGTCGTASCEGQCCVCVPPPVCGDGVSGPGEDCSEPGLPACPQGQLCKDCQCSGFCGNGTPEFGEECGEPGLVACAPGKLCSQCSCQSPPPKCGNGTPEINETCGEPSLKACPKKSLCTNCACVVQPRCGDGVINQAREQCESSADCPDPKKPFCGECRCMVQPVCGNGKKEFGERCDGTGQAQCEAGLYCESCTCKRPLTCGNRVLDSGEACDRTATDGNICTGGQSCNANCVCVTATTCPNGVKDPGEACDPQAKELSDRSCPAGQKCSDCKCVVIPAVCGDGIAQSGESCDPPGIWNCKGDEDGDGFSDEICDKCVCLSVKGDPICGNGRAEAGEKCSEPQLPACPVGFECAQCQCKPQPPRCGDGKPDSGEACGEPGLACPSYTGGILCQQCQCKTQDQSCPTGQTCMTASNCTQSGGQTAGACYINGDPAQSGYCCNPPTKPECRITERTVEATGPIPGGCLVWCKITEEICPGQEPKIISVKKEMPAGQTYESQSDASATGEAPIYNCDGTPMPPNASDLPANPSAYDVAICPSPS